MKKIATAWLIDDDETSTYIVSKLIRLIDFSKTVLVFGNGQDAIKNLRDLLEAQEGFPSIIFLNINMPLMDGWQFLDHFRLLELPKKFTIYVLSSSLDNPDGLKAATYKDVSDIYVKPITKENLIEMLNNQ